MNDTILITNIMESMKPKFCKYNYSLINFVSPLRRQFKLTILLPVIVTIFTCIGCTKDLPENLTEDEIIRRKQSAIFSGIQEFPLIAELPIANDTISKKVSASSILLTNPYDGKNDWHYTRQSVFNVTGAKNKYIFNYTPLNSNWYPGALIQGKSIAKGTFEEIPLNDKRKAATIFLRVCSGDSESIKETIEPGSFSGAEVTQRINDILARYTSGFPADYTCIAPFAINSVYDLAYGLDMNKEEFEDFVGNTFSTIKWDERRVRVAILLKQVYFEVSYDNHGGFGGMFDSSISKADLSEYMGADNPPCYMKSIHYGRLFAAVYEGGAGTTEKQLIDALSRAINGKPFPRSTREQYLDKDYRTIKNARLIGVAAKGGDAKVISSIATDPVQLHECIVNGSVVNRQNVGVPIEAQIYYLHNHQQVVNPVKVEGQVSCTDYILAPKENNIKITLRNIHSPNVYRDGGHKNHNIDTDTGNTYFEVSNAEYKVIKAGETEQNGTCYFYVKSGAAQGDKTININKTIYLGEIGKDPKDCIIELKFPHIKYRVRRHWGGILNNTDPNKTTEEYFSITHTFEYKSISKSWECHQSQNLSNGTSTSGFTPFKTAYLNNRINYGRYSFHLNYTFTVDNWEYPLK